MNDYQYLIRRNPVWAALSEFYIDNQLTADDFDRIAHVFQNSGYRLDEIKDIDLLEVFPLLQQNLLSVAGVWTGFDEDWLVENCRKNYLRRKNRLHRSICKFWNLLFYWMRRDYWEQIERRMQ